MAKMKHAMHNASSSATWLDCSLSYHYKKEAISKGKEWGTSGEAAKRGVIQHDVAENAMRRILKGTKRSLAITQAIKAGRKKVPKNEVENVTIAIDAVLDLIPSTFHGQLVKNIVLEREVPLSHEPGQVGYIDFCTYDESFALIADYKFGQMAVSPNSSQLKIYAANFLNEIGDMVDSYEVKLAIIQPQLHREALVRSYTAGELRKFQAYVEQVVDNQVNGHDRRGAGSLDSCTWCPAAKLKCFHRKNLMSNMMSDLDTTDELADHIIEHIHKSKGAFKKIMDECSSIIIDSPKRFPNWSRVEVSNARAWSELLDVSEIESQLVDAGAEEIHTLRTPKQIEDENPDLTKLIGRLTAKQGHHVRLYPGKPKEGTPKKEPAKRPKAKSPKVKPSAKKKAAKRKR